MTTRLIPDTKAPELSLPLVGGGRFTLADAKPSLATMVITYRGYHCPLCKLFVEKLTPLVPQFADAGVDTVLISMDSEERAVLARDEWAITVPVGYGMTADAARNWGLWLTKAIRDGEPDIFAEPGLFWIRPDGTLWLIDVSSMPQARPDLGFLAGRATAALAKGYPARGAWAG